MSPSPSCQVLAVANESPGSTKTTTAIALAISAVESGHQTVLIDLDPNMGATQWLGMPACGRNNIGAILADHYPLGWAEGLAVRTRWSQALAVVPGVGADFDARLSPGIASRLRLALTNTDRFDLAIIDCPAHDRGARIGNALAAASDLIAVTNATWQSLAGVSAAIGTMNNYRESPTLQAQPLRLRGVILGDLREPPQSAPSEHPRALTILQETWPEALTPTIPHSPELANARAAGKSLTALRELHRTLVPVFDKITPQVLD